jgi:hypothetical protein
VYENQEVARQVAGDYQGEVGGPPRAVIIAAIALGVAAIAVILGIAATRGTPSQPLALPAVPAPQASDGACRALQQALPQKLGDYQRAPLAQPAPEGATAWRASPDSEPVVLRCGLDRPGDFVVGSPIQVVDRVQWFEVDRSWYAVDRPVYIALTLPTGSGPTPIQELSEVIDRTIAAVPINPRPAG